MIHPPPPEAANFLFSPLYWYTLLVKTNCSSVPSSENHVIPSKFPTPTSQQIKNDWSVDPSSAIFFQEILWMVTSMIWAMIYCICWTYLPPLSSKSCNLSIIRPSVKHATNSSILEAQVCSPPVPKRARWLPPRAVWALMYFVKSFALNRSGEGGS